ncbi:MAG TPA: glutamate racemase [Fimbriimonas sp.]|nr:glutamate racemase [Fimbriimonas sp.]
MWIGVFDSGLGGLAIAQAIQSRLPEYNYLYLGDTKRVPYGTRSQETIHEFVSDALNYLFEHECQLVILACNTASAEALRKSQQEYLPRFYPDRRVLGVIIPTCEEAAGCESVGVLATASTVESDAYGREMRRVHPSATVVQQSAPLLVPLIENDGLKYIDPVIDDYMAPLSGVDSVILGCTHYCLIKERVRARTRAKVISQDEIVPEKLADYLRRHPEIEGRLGRTKERRYCVTDWTATYEKLSTNLAGRTLELEKVTL